MIEALLARGWNVQLVHIAKEDQNGFVRVKTHDGATLGECIGFQCNTCYDERLQLMDNVLWRVDNAQMLANAVPGMPAKPLPHVGILRTLNADKYEITLGSRSAPVITVNYSGYNPSQLESLVIALLAHDWALKLVHVPRSGKKFVRLKTRGIDIAGSRDFQPERIPTLMKKLAEMRADMVQSAELEGKRAALAHGAFRSSHTPMHNHTLLPRLGRSSSQPSIRAPTLPKPGLPRMKRFEMDT